MENKYFKTFKEAWKFVYSLTVNGYDYTKQKESCEAFKLINAICEKADKEQLSIEDYLNY